jgi:hypothetical protein
MPKHEHPAFSFHIEGRDREVHSAPAAVLVRLLQNAQLAFDLIGVHVEGREIKRRARISSATSQRFQLICGIPQTGSYAMPVTVGQANGLFDLDFVKRAYDVFHSLVQAVSAHDSARVAAALPNERIRRRVLESIKSMAPQTEANWKLSLHDETDTVFANFDAAIPAFVDSILITEEQREAGRVITGELKRIDFAERKLTLIYPPTSKELACIYDEDIEDLLYARRRDLIQVTGRVLLDDEGAPRQIIDVTDIRDLDLSPVVLDTLHFGELHIQASPALSVEPELDDTQQLLCVVQEALGIDVFAPTRETLLAELNEQLAMLWREYALAPDAELDDKAQSLKQALRARFAEVPHAAQAA